MAGCCALQKDILADLVPPLLACPGLIALRRCIHRCAKMLQLRMLSGETVACIPVEEIHDVKALKQRLTQMHGMPPRFRQRVLLHGENLEDDVALDGPMSLDLALLGFADVSQQQVDELAAAALHGSISEVGSQKQCTCSCSHT